LFFELSIGHFLFFRKIFKEMAFKNQFVKFLRERGVPDPEEEVEV
jgi:hypothetical protein